jgi:alpha-mannosidase
MTSYCPLSALRLAFAACGMAMPAFAQAPPQSPIPVLPRPASVMPGKQAPKVTDVWVIFKTHCDLGYTMTAEAVNEKYRVAMMDNAIRLREADQAKPAEERFKWTIAGWPMAANILGPKQDPARREKVEQGLRDGSFAVHALPASLHTESLDLEDHVRGLGFASRVARAYGKPLPISAKMTDVPGHAWIMPTLLANAGVKFLQIGCNYSNRSILLPHLFWWEGPDGSRVLCNYTVNYGSDVPPPADWPAKNYLAVVMTHDNEGPPSPGEVKRVRGTVAKMPGVKLHFATMDDFARAVIAENPNIPVIRGDMVDAWIHGISSMPQEIGLARRVRPLEPALEMLDTELRTWNLPTADAAPKLAEAYENSMLFGEHTFGAMCPWYGFWATGLPGRYYYGQAFRDARERGFYKKFESSFDDKRAFIRKTAGIVDDGLRERLDLLAKSVKAEGERVVVFNPLPWKRSGLVEVDGRRYFAKDVPAGGYLTLQEPGEGSAEPVSASEPAFETRHFKVTLDLKRGGITSLLEKATGRELVDKGSSYALGQFLHEKFGASQVLDYYNRYCTMNNSFNATAKPNMPADVKYETLTPANWSASVRHSALADTVTLTAGDTRGLAQGIAITFTFPIHEATLETALKMTGKEPETLPEGGWLCFPTSVSNARYLLGRLGGPMDLAKDQLPGGNRYLYAVQSGVALTSPDCSGVGLCAIDAPTMSFGEPGLWKYDYDYLPKSPTVFVQLYNNMWNTNFPYWSEGDITTRVKLWPVGKGSADAFTLQSWEARVPLLAAKASGAGGNLPPANSGVELSRKGILVTAFGSDPDGNRGTLLRLWNQAESSGPLTVTLPAGFKATKARPVSLRGEPKGQPAEVKDGRFTLSLGKLQPASFILE